MKAIRVPATHIIIIPMKVSTLTPVCLFIIGTKTTVGITTAGLPAT